jgi:probable addiction module antidote protein
VTAPRNKSYDDALAESLKDSTEDAAYVEDALDLDNSAALLAALRHVAKAHGMAEVARRADMGDKTLLLALSENGNPTISRVHKVLQSDGLRLSVTPARQPAPDQQPIPAAAFKLQQEHGIAGSIDPRRDARRLQFNQRHHHPAKPDRFIGERWPHPVLAGGCGVAVVDG